MWQLKQLPIYTEVRYKRMYHCIVVMCAPWRATALKRHSVALVPVEWWAVWRLTGVRAVKLKNLCIIVLVFSFSVTDPYGSTGSGKLKINFHKSCYVVHMTWVFSVRPCNQYPFRGKANTWKSETPYWRTGMTSWQIFYPRSGDSKFLVLEKLLVYTWYTSIFFNTETKRIYREYKMAESNHRW